MNRGSSSSSAAKGNFNSPRSNKSGVRKRVIASKRFSIGKPKPSHSRPRTNASGASTPRAARFGQFGDEVDAATQRGNIKVVVRVRPKNEREAGPSHSTVVQAVDANIVVFDPIVDSSDFYFHGVKQRNANYLKRKNKDKKFVFDHVYGPDSRNAEIFEETIKPTIDTILAGYNCSVFAYGATGSGKTHTMVGRTDDDLEPGLTYLTVMELFGRLQDMKQDYESEISMSYLEVYNEQVKDLLTPSENILNVLEHPAGVLIPKLTEHKPEDVADILRLLKDGNSRRTQHATDQNQESSRSHAVFQVLVKLRSRYSDLVNQYKGAKLVMVDLAGSERGAATGFHGARFREGASINKSLLALGNCINALAEGKKHVPYRDSKLTRILKDALGGNCKTVMIANVSPSDITYEDSFNTLKYADRAKRIKFNVKKNTMTFSARAVEYVKVVQEMSDQIAHLKDVVKEYERSCRCKTKVLKVDCSTDTDDIPTQITIPESPKPRFDATFIQSKYNSSVAFGSELGGSDNTAFPPATCAPAYLARPQTYRSLTDTDVMKQEPYKNFERFLNENVRLESLSNDLMTQLREMDWKVKRKEARLNGAKTLLVNDSVIIKGLERMKKQHETLVQKKTDYERRLQKVQEDIANVNIALVNAENSFRGVEKNDIVSVSKDDFFKLKRLQAKELLQSNFQAQIQPSFSALFGEVVKTEALLHQSLCHMKTNHFLLKSVGRSSKESDQSYSDIMADYFSARIQFNIGNNNETKTLALSPYCDNINLPNKSHDNSNGNSGNETDVSSSTDNR